MAEADWKKLAQQAFLETGRGAGLELEAGQAMKVWRLRLESGHPPGEVLQPMDLLLRSAGALVEAQAWLALGTQVGSFEKPGPLAEVDRVIVGAGAAYEGEGQWPESVRRFAQQLAAGEAPVRLEWDVPDDAEAGAIVQAAMVLAEGFTENLVAHLQRNLQAEVSILDEDRPSVSAEACFEALRQHGDDFEDFIDWKADWPCSVAGFLQLTSLLSAFDSLFPPGVSREEFVRKPSTSGASFELEEVTDPEDRTRFLVSRAVTNILSWRLDLWDERTYRRLEAVGNAFWDLCRREFQENRDAGMAFSEAESRAEWQRLLTAWETRIRFEENTARLRYVEEVERERREVG